MGIEERQSVLEDWVGSTLARIVRLEKKLESENEARQKLENEVAMLKAAKKAGDDRVF